MSYEQFTLPVGKNGKVQEESNIFKARRGRVTTFLADDFHGAVDS